MVVGSSLMATGVTILAALARAADKVLLKGKGRTQKRGGTDFGNGKPRRYRLARRLDKIPFRNRIARYR